VDTLLEGNWFFDRNKTMRRCVCRELPTEGVQLKQSGNEIRKSCLEKLDVVERDCTTHIGEFGRFKKTNRKGKPVRSLTAKARANISKTGPEAIIFRSAFRGYV
jgi:hypothetical protein